MRPIIPSWTRSPTSIEFGMVDAMRRASASTNGRPATIRRFWLTAIGWVRIPTHHRNAYTKSPADVPKHDSTVGYIYVSYVVSRTYASVSLRHDLWPFG